MVLLAAGISKSGGDIIVSRQFVEMPRSRVEGLFGSFHKLKEANVEHTFVETDAVRYVYQPLEELFLILITTKNSNILEDLETMRLFARMIPDYCDISSPADVSENAFDLIFAFDEIVALGYRENIDAGQIRTIMAMESHDEEVALRMHENKVKGAAEVMKQKALEMEIKKRAGIKSEYGQNAMSSAMPTPNYPQQIASPNLGPKEDNSYEQPATSRTNLGGSSGKGMKLGVGKKGKTDNFLDNLGNEDRALQGRGSRLSTINQAQQAQAPIQTGSMEPQSVRVKFEDRIHILQDREGCVHKLDLEGCLKLLITDANMGKVKLGLELPQDIGLAYKLHPQIDKQLFSDNVQIGLKAPDKSFPIDNEQILLRYKSEPNSGITTPIAVTVWPSPNGSGGCDMNLEYEVNVPGAVVENLTVTIPSQTKPVIGSCDGQCDFNSQSIVWKVPYIDNSNKNGNLEFTTAVGDEDSFFPIQVTFSINKSVTQIACMNAQSSMDGSGISYSATYSLQCNNFTIQ